MIKRIAFSVLVALSLGGCAVFHRAPQVQVRAIATPERVTAVQQADAEYQAASAAIWRRDYARALDLLQAARAHRPNDVRVLNGFGVVYDKLGRFDLSARYYAQAMALDPSSQIVAQNLAYSAFLQGATPAPRALAAVEADRPLTLVEHLAPAVPLPSTLAGATRPTLASEPAPATPPVPPVVTLAAAAPQPTPLAPQRGVIRIAPGVVMLQLAEAPPRPNPLPALTGHPLILVNATGRADGAESVRTRLADLGWSAANPAVPTAAMASRTLIRYSPDDARAAQALARTLPRPVALVACADGCDGVSLIVGTDAAAWDFTRRTARRRS